jgi:hypothetical protein
MEESDGCIERRIGHRQADGILGPGADGEQRTARSGRQASDGGSEKKIGLEEESFLHYVF